MISPSILILLIFIVILLTGAPIGTALGVASIFSIWYYNYGVSVIAPNFYGNIAKFPLLAIPFFVFAGIVMEKAGIAEKITKFIKALVGWLPGGLAIATVLIGTFWGAVSGSGPASAAAIGVILIPYLIKAGYGKAFSASLVATVAGLSIIIPPSVAYIIYGTILNVSIGALFIAGVIPGLILGAVLSVTAYLISLRRGYRGSEKPSPKEVWITFKESISGLLAPIIILGGIYAGVFTPTEAAVVAVAYSLFLGLVVYRTITLKDVIKILADSVEVSSVVMFVVAFAGLFSWAEQTAGLVEATVGWTLSLTQEPLFVMLLFMVILLFAGMFLDAISIYYIFLPIMLPIINHFGWDLIWFGVLMTINLAIGQVTPPVAVNAYVTSRISGAKLEDIGKESIPLLIAVFSVLILLILFPQLILWLPNLMKRSP
ncbi:MAG: TRAP transporter large permease [Zestosphaera sp.]